MAQPKIKSSNIIAKSVVIDLQQIIRVKLVSPIPVLKTAAERRGFFIFREFVPIMN
jgi:hypothetical protein